MACLKFRILSSALNGRNNATSKQRTAKAARMLNKPGFSYGDASRNTPNASAMRNFLVDVRIGALIFAQLDRLALSHVAMYSPLPALMSSSKADPYDAPTGTFDWPESTCDRRQFRNWPGRCDCSGLRRRRRHCEPVSYTHLTLPT